MSGNDEKNLRNCFDKFRALVIRIYRGQKE